VQFSLKKQPCRLVYRRYASLLFTFCVDENANELAVLEAIHMFVELLDKFFSSVCELDIILYFGAVYSLIDEMIVAGQIQETDVKTIIARAQAKEI